MDQMLPSPSFNIPSIGTPHHVMEEDAMINPQAQAAQQSRQGGPTSNLQNHSTPNSGSSNPFGFGGMTPQSFLSAGQTPSNLLQSPAVPSTPHAPTDKIPSKTEVQSSAPPVYAPCLSPAPPSPAPGSTQATSSLVPPSPLETAIVPQLQNIVSTVSLCCRLDLKKIALHARNAEYNPKRFAAVIMRIREPRTTALIFSSGKMVCTGAKSEEDSKMAARKYARIVQKLGFPAKFKDFKIQNMVGSCDVRFPIRLEGLVLTHSQFSSYEPELFPGLIYRMVKPRIVLLIFVSGKVVLTGAKVRSEIYEAFDNIHPILKNFKKQ